MTAYTHEFDTNEAGSLLAEYKLHTEVAMQLEAEGKLTEALDVAKTIAEILFELLIVTTPDDAREAFVAAAQEFLPTESAAALAAANE